MFLTRGICFPGRGTYMITSDMGFPGRGMHITKDMCSWVVKPFYLGFVFSR